MDTFLKNVAGTFSPVPAMKAKFSKTTGIPIGTQPTQEETPPNKNKNKTEETLPASILEDTVVKPQRINFETSLPTDEPSSSSHGPMIPIDKGPTLPTLGKRPNIDERSPDRTHPPDASEHEEKHLRDEKAKLMEQLKRVDETIVEKYAQKAVTKRAKSQDKDVTMTKAELNAIIAEKCEQQKRMDEAAMHGQVTALMEQIQTQANSQISQTKIDADRLIRAKEDEVNALKCAGQELERAMQQTSMSAANHKRTYDDNLRLFETEASIDKSRSIASHEQSTAQHENTTMNLRAELQGERQKAEQRETHLFHQTQLLETKTEHDKRILAHKAEELTAGLQEAHAAVMQKDAQVNAITGEGQAILEQRQKEHAHTLLQFQLQQEEFARMSQQQHEQFREQAATLMAQNAAKDDELKALKETIDKLAKAQDNQKVNADSQSQPKPTPQEHYIGDRVRAKSKPVKSEGLVLKLNGGAKPIRTTRSSSPRTRSSKVSRNARGRSPTCERERSPIDLSVDKDKYKMNTARATSHEPAHNSRTCSKQCEHEWNEDDWDKWNEWYNDYDGDEEGNEEGGKYDEQPNEDDSDIDVADSEPWQIGKKLNKASRKLLEMKRKIQRLQNEKRWRNTKRKREDKRKNKNGHDPDDDDSPSDSDTDTSSSEGTQDDSSDDEIASSDNSGESDDDIPKLKDPGDPKFSRIKLRKQSDINSQTHRPPNSMQLANLPATIPGLRAWWNYTQVACAKMNPLEEKYILEWLRRVHVIAVQAEPENAAQLQTLFDKFNDSGMYVDLDCKLYTACMKILQGSDQYTKSINQKLSLLTERELNANRSVKGRQVLLLILIHYRSYHKHERFHNINDVIRLRIKNGNIRGYLHKFDELIQGFRKPPSIRRMNKEILEQFIEECKKCKGDERITHLMTRWKNFKTKNKRRCYQWIRTKLDAHLWTSMYQDNTDGAKDGGPGGVLPGKGKDKGKQKGKGKGKGKSKGKGKAGSKGGKGYYSQAGAAKSKGKGKASKGKGKGQGSQWRSASQGARSSYQPQPNKGQDPKTIYCRYFNDKGHCSFGSQCQFAHSPEQVKKATAAAAQRKQSGERAHSHDAGRRQYSPHPNKFDQKGGKAKGKGKDKGKGKGKDSKGKGKGKGKGGKAKGKGKDKSGKAKGKGDGKANATPAKLDAYARFKERTHGMSSTKLLAMAAKKAEEEKARKQKKENT